MKKMFFCYGIGVTTIVAKSIKNIISTINNNNLFIAFISLKNVMTSQTTFRQRHVNPMVSNKLYVDEPRCLYWKQTLDIAGWRTLLWHLTQYTGDTQTGVLDSLQRTSLYLKRTAFIISNFITHKSSHHNTPPTLTEQSYSKTTKTKGSSKAFFLKPKIYSWMSVWVRLQDSEGSDI